jgi:hypothetical protein
MFIKYNSHDLLSLFCNEPKIIEKDAEIFEYSKEDEFGFKLIFYISVYDNFASIMLEHKNYKKPIFDIGISNISEIDVDYNLLRIIDQNSKSLFNVYFQPNFRIAISDVKE